LIDLAKHIVSDPSPWNGVTITTAILSLLAIIVTLLVLALTWANIPKPYFNDETDKVDWRSWVDIVNRGAGTADNVRLEQHFADGWATLHEWNTISHNGHIGKVFYPEGGYETLVRLSWTAHPLPWFRRSKRFRYNPPSLHGATRVEPGPDVH
jgi:hypothetical protein